jgi:hypothetical protein
MPLQTELVSAGTALGCRSGVSLLSDRGGLDAERHPAQYECHDLRIRLSILIDRAWKAAVREVAHRGLCCSERVRVVPAVRGRPSRTEEAW